MAIANSTPFSQIAKTLYGKEERLTLALQYSLKNPNAKISYDGKNWSYEAGTLKLHRYDRFLHLLKMCFSKNYRWNFQRAVSVLEMAKNDYNARISKADSLRAKVINKCQSKINHSLRTIQQLEHQIKYAPNKEVQADLIAAEGALRRIRKDIEHYSNIEISKALAAQK